MPLPKDIPEEISKLAVSSRAGAVLFLKPDAGYLVLPPFPIGERSTVRGFFIEPLLSMLKRNYQIALVLVRLGAYAIGVCHGESIVSSKVGTGLVHGRHRQGGSSAARFRRHREKQIEYFLTRVCQHAREQLEPQAKALDYVVYGGAWTTILLL
jgi:peptide subunit release factor 1 (eRF1)